MPTRRCWVEVDGRAIRHNLQVLRRLVPKTTQFLAVVKANAYGHGLVPVARELASLGTDWFGVAHVAEGAILRQAGIRQPILLLSAVLPGEMAEAIELGLTLTLSQFQEGRTLDRIANQLGQIAEVHFKIDTGMGRLGYWHSGAGAELARLKTLRHLSVKGLYTHFAAADENEKLTSAQWKKFSPFLPAHPGLLRHAANSPAVTRGYGFHADMVRAGLALYGVNPAPSDPGPNLQPALTWKTRIGLLREVEAGRTISYGATYRVPKKQRHAVLAMGYGDGYFRLHSNRSEVLVRGVRCPIRGRVTMDQIVVDVTRVPICRVGDEVVALGRQGGKTIDAQELATGAQTIPWEILTNIGERVPRIYRHFSTRDT